MTVEAKTASRVVVGTYVPPKVTAEACRPVLQSSYWRGAVRPNVAVTQDFSHSSGRWGRHSVEASDRQRRQTQAPHKTEPRWEDANTAVLYEHRLTFLACRRGLCDELPEG